MRDRMERLVVLPFSFGCASHSSVELGTPTKPTADTKGSLSLVTRRQAGEERSSKSKMKKSRPSSGFLALPKPNIASGIQRLVRGIKSLSQLFFYKEEIEMEIGYPTDVKHVTHIGLDGSTTTNNVMGWDSLNLKPPELLSFSSISFKQFELAMPAQPLLTHTSPHFG